jgi:hypothetical protein
MSKTFKKKQYDDEPVVKVSKDKVVLPKRRPKKINVRNYDEELDDDE